jgi:hypothetical protein
LKRFRLSVEYMGSEPYLDQNLEQKLIDKLPSVCNITFSDSKKSYSEEHAHDGTWSGEVVLDA